MCYHVHRPNDAMVQCVYLCDLSAFMIASQQGHMRGIPSLQQHEQGEGFQAVVPSINKVPHKDVVCAWNFSPCLKQLEQIMELAMNVSTDLGTEQML